MTILYSHSANGIPFVKEAYERFFHFLPISYVTLREYEMFEDYISIQGGVNRMPIIHRLSSYILIAYVLILHTL